MEDLSCARGELADFACAFKDNQGLISIERGNSHAAVHRNFFGGEERAFNKYAFAGLGSGGVGAEVADTDAVFKMQFTRAAVVVEPVGDVGGLLNFAESQATADGVDCSGGYEKSVAGIGVVPFE